jgi:transcriptional regulator of nitric oxide reductase
MADVWFDVGDCQTVIRKGDEVARGVTDEALLNQLRHERDEARAIVSYDCCWQRPDPHKQEKRRRRSQQWRVMWRASCGY